MDQEFQAAYKTLNTAQKAAVDTIDGPVLVVAGPGTGKTQLLSLRVANILRQTDTDAGSILCLTFTNFAATNMRERLAALVGSTAHNVVVRTFHSFAAEIMNLYPDYFWNGARLGIAPDAAQLEIIQDILAKLPLDNPLALKFAGAYTMVNDVQQALKLAKEAGLTPEKLAAMLAVNEAYLDVIEPQLAEILSAPLSNKKLPALQTAIEALPEQSIDASVTPLSSLSTVLKESLATAIASDQTGTKTTATGKWKQRWLQTVAGEKGMFDERRRNAWWQAVAPVYAAYRDQLHQRGYYDYSDMIVEVITQLEQQPELLASVQERFLYTLIDEFQDTNAAQLRLSHLVASHAATEGRPNLLAVGDDDQSIFAFNGAEINNMLAFRHTYKEVKVIVLQDNYRSTQAILDSTRTIIEQADDRLVKREADLTKNLRAVAKVPKGTIQHLSYPTRQHQLSGIADEVQKAWQKNDGQAIAVLARAHSSLRELSALLASRGVAIRYEQQNNVLDQPVVSQICLLAEIVEAITVGDHSTANYNIARLLRHPSWHVKPAMLWQLARSNYPRADWLSSLAGSGDEQLVTVAEWLHWLAGQAAQESLPVLLDYLIGLRAGSHLTSPLREYFLASQPVDNHYLEGLSALQRLREATTEFAAARPATTRLSDFVRFVRLHRTLDRPITDESWFISGERAVQLLTVHKAKGLEFDTVYLLDAIEDTWRPRHQGRKPPANLPLQPYGEQYDDYVRLLYVAATRAKSSFIVSSFYSDEQGRTLLPTPLIGQLPVTRITPETTSNPVAVLEQSLSWPRLESNDERALLGARLTDYRLSATALLQFLDVASGGPQHFLERQILRLPEMTTPTMAYGIAVHSTLQTAQQLTNSGQFTIEKILQNYETALQQQALTTNDYNRYLTHGKQVLRALFVDKNFRLPKGGQAEIDMGEVRLGEARLGGKIDQLYAKDAQLQITDYKTGTPLSSLTTRDQTKAVKAWRHRTQLLFYALLARHSGRFAAVDTITTQLLYVEAEDASTMSLTLLPQPEEIQHLEQLIAATWSHIHQLDFPDSRHYTEDIAGIQAFEEDLLRGDI